MARISILSVENSYLKLHMLRQRRRRRHPTNIFYLERNKDGEFHRLYKKLKRCPKLFHGYTRMLPSTFYYVLNAIKGKITHATTNFQQPISPEERLIVTLRYLATGMQFRQLAYSFCISKSAVAKIVSEVCKAIWTTLVMAHMPQPTKSTFEFPNCIGCIDGKHIRIKCPPKSSSMYYNYYKNYFSIGLLALTDANYKFIMVDVGSYGKESDGGLFENCALHKAIESAKLELPEETTLPGTDIMAPFVFLGDEAFPLREYLMRPFPRTTLRDDEENESFNYRLSRARMVVECSFGRIVTKFRVLYKAIETNVCNAIDIVKAITLIHNIIIDIEGTTDAEMEYFKDPKIDSLAPHILKKDTNCRKSTPPADQLAVTLRFLATGDSFTSLMYSHRISKSSLSDIIKRVCEAIVTELSDEIKWQLTAALCYCLPVADDAFELSDNICKPFPGYYAKNSWQRIFYYRMCRARRIVANSLNNFTPYLCVLFGIYVLFDQKAALERNDRLIDTKPSTRYIVFRLNRQTVRRFLIWHLWQKKEKEKGGSEGTSEKSYVRQKTVFNEKLAKNSERRIKQRIERESALATPLKKIKNTGSKEIKDCVYNFCKFLRHILSMFAKINFVIFSEVFSEVFIFHNRFYFLILEEQSILIWFMLFQI
nr:unnamed protein product [Callosobruchus chinensis]